jgi:uncharacterized repeat protein (TIGR03806 family)
MLLLGLLTLAPIAPLAADTPPSVVQAPDIDLPEGFVETVVASGLNGATAMDVAPDGRVFVCEQAGALRVVKNDQLLAEPFVALKVDGFWERGLIGVTLDPDFPKNGYVYVCYVSPAPYPHHVVSRFTAKGDVAAPDSEVVLLEGDDQTKLGGAVPAGHQGGAIHFGKDGKLYVAIGEQTAGAPAQRLDTFQGKLLRINPDGSIPEDNPFYDKTKGKYRAIWALGLRNPFAFAVQPGTGRILIDDVGDARWEEINEGAAGANYGWPESEGPTADPRFRTPLYAYDHGVGRCIAGGAFYDPPTRQFPAAYAGKYFFADYMDNWLRVLDPDDPHAATVFATGLAGPVDVKVAPDGSLYVLNRRAWVKDDQFKNATGTLHRIFYAGGAGRPLPRVTTQPEDCGATPDQSATFRVAADGQLGDAPLRYQWLRDGKPVPGADAAEYTLASARQADDGAEFRCLVSNAIGRTRSARAALHVLAPRPADAPDSVLPGLNYSYFEGQWDYLPPFDLLEPVKTGAADRFDAAPRGRDEHFGLAFDGFLEVAREGAYTFRLASDGPAYLFVGGAEAVRLGGAARMREASGSVGLKPGRHSIRLLYTHGAGKPSLRLRYAGPGVDEQEVPGSRLSHAEAAAPPAVDAHDEPGKKPYGLPRRETVATLDAPADPADLPPLLSQTGVFRSLKDLSPNPGIIPYTVNAPLWSDGAAKRRWIALPGDARIEFAPQGEWRFPPGTVFVKHFELPTAGAPRRLETRLLVMGRGGIGYGVTYKWKPDQSDAELLSGGLTEEVALQTPAGSAKRKWTYPSRTDCLVCHTANAGFVLGVKTRQLNGDFTYPNTGVKDNQLRTWSRLGLFRQAIAEDDIAKYDRLAAVTDATATPEHRVRSYLDSNCAQCHRPGGARSGFDARFDTALPGQKLILGPVTSTDLGTARAALIAPRDLARSMIYQRMKRRQDVFNMPPLASQEPDTEALAVLEEWIMGLSEDKRPDGEKQLK